MLVHLQTSRKDVVPIMTGREPAQTIDDHAADWASRLDRGLDETEQRELDSWLASDRRRVGALARARAIWLGAERAQSLGSLITERTTDALMTERSTADEPAQPSRLTRRAAMFGGGAMAAALVGAVALPLLHRRDTALRSGLGEIRRLPLEDGSVVTLDTDSMLEVAFSRTSRTVRLEAGRAFFEVVDGVRPFLVETGDLVLRASASAFSVRALPGLPVALLVSRGHVDLQSPLQGPAITVAANMEASALPRSAAGAPVKLARLGPDEVDRILSWRNGMLAFEGETLGQAASDFGRYGLPRIEITDPKLAATPITGLFTANDPAGFARAIALSLGIEAHGDDKVVRLMPARRA